MCVWFLLFFNFYVYFWFSLYYWIVFYSQVSIFIGNNKMNWGLYYFTKKIGTDSIKCIWVCIKIIDSLYDFSLYGQLLRNVSRLTKLSQASISITKRIMVHLCSFNSYVIKVNLWTLNKFNESLCSNVSELVILESVVQHFHRKSSQFDVLYLGWKSF